MKIRLLLTLIFPVFSFAQASLDKTILLDSLKFETSRTDYVYSRVIKNYNTIQNEYWVTDYYKSGEIEMSGKSVNRDQLTKKGLFTYYFENGNRRELVNYQNSIKLGAYFSWYENGKDKAIGEYLKNEKADDTEGYLKINQFWNADGVQKIIDGNGIYEDVEDEYTSSEGMLKEGLKDSIWNGSNKKLGTTFTEEYQAGLLIFGTSTDKNGIQYHYKELLTEAKPAYGATAFRASILKNIKYNMESKFYGKSLVLRFDIDKEGNIRNVISLMGISPEIDTKAISLLRGAAKWFPGLSRGVKCQKQYFFPINMPNIIRR